MRFWRTAFYQQSPLAFVISWLFVPFNVVIALYLWAQHQKGIMIFNVSPFLGTWSVIFLVLAGWLLYGLISERHALTRAAMIGGLFAKAFWAYVLLYYSVSTGFINNLAVLDMWAMIALVQAATVIWFLPQKRDGKWNRKPTTR